MRPRDGPPSTYAITSGEEASLVHQVDRHGGTVPTRVHPQWWGVATVAARNSRSRSLYGALPSTRNHFLRSDRAPSLFGEGWGGVSALVNESTPYVANEFCSGPAASRLQPAAYVARRGYHQYTWG